MNEQERALQSFETERSEQMKKLWAVGDGATGGTDAEVVASMIARDMPDAFLWLGDVYESGTPGDFSQNYHTSWGQMNKVCKPIPGNHDWPNYTSGYQPYFTSAGCPAQPNYIVQFKDEGWTLWMLNSEDVGEAAAFVRTALTQTEPVANRKNIACWHRPRYCSGSHGDATDTDVLWQLLAPHCAVILGGHAHNMQQFKPDATGCIQIVSGAGGRSLYAEIPNDERLAWGKSDGYGAVCLLLRDAQLVIDWFDETGTNLNSSTISVA